MGLNKILPAGFLILGLFALTSCEVLLGKISILNDITTYNPPTSFDYKLSSSARSKSASHTLSFDFSGETLETYKIILKYPKKFRFKGFRALGKKNSNIGFYKLDSGSDGDFEADYVIRAINAKRAYVDQNKDGKYNSAFEAYISYKKASSHVFTIILPYGGDGTSYVSGGTFDGTMTIKLLKKILINPRKAGTYTVKADFTSIDPDSGDADDSTGTSPSTFSTTKDLTIGK